MQYHWSAGRNVLSDPARLSIVAVGRMFSAFCAVSTAPVFFQNVARDATRLSDAPGSLSAKKAKNLEGGSATTAEAMIFF